MAKFKVAVGAGHGGKGSTPGKRTPAGEYEWNFNDKVVKAFISELSKYENVEILRLDDASGKTDVYLSPRVNKAIKFGANIYVSFHHNALESKWGTWTGVETYQYSGSSESEKLAKLVHPKIVSAYGLRDRGIKKGNHLYEVRATPMPAILVEGGFMDSTIDIKKLRSDSVLANAGKGAAQAVAQYAGLKKKDTPKPQTPQETSGATYKVVKGDTLWGISKKTGVSVNNLKSYNGLKDDVIYVGQVLKFTGTKVHTVIKGDTLWAIARKYNVTVNSIKAANGLSSNVIHAGDKLVIK